MKKRCYLPLIVLLILSLNSCALLKGKVGVSDDGLIFNDQTYSISSEEFWEYNFYVYEGELISVQHNGALISYYKVENPDFGTALRVTHPIWDKVVKTTYIFEKNINMPNIRTLSVDEIVLIESAYSNNDVYKENHSSVLSSEWSYVVDKKDWNPNNEHLNMTQIVEFENQFTFENIDYKMYRKSVAFIPKDYTSFYSGIYEMIEYEKELYISIEEHSVFYKINQEYQQILNH